MIINNCISCSFMVEFKKKCYNLSFFVGKGFVLSEGFCILEKADTIIDLYQEMAFKNYHVDVLRFVSDVAKNIFDVEV